MEIKEAINVVEQVCANFRGTLQEHQHIQNAIKLIKSEIEKGDSKLGDANG